MLAILIFVIFFVSYCQHFRTRMLPDSFPFVPKPFCSLAFFLCFYPSLFSFIRLAGEPHPGKAQHKEKRPQFMSAGAKMLIFFARCWAEEQSLTRLHHYVHCVALFRRRSKHIFRKTSRQRHWLLLHSLQYPDCHIVEKSRFSTLHNPRYFDVT